jgi:hypothetical protein
MLAPVFKRRRHLASISRHSSRRLTFIFLGVVVPSAATLVWLGLRLLEQDRILSAQRDLERQDAAADTLVRSLTQTIAEINYEFTGGTAIEHTVRIRREGDVIDVEPRDRVAWLPVPRPSSEPTHLFADGERLECAVPGWRASAATSARRSRIIAP